MSFNEYVAFQLNGESNFSDRVTEYFAETRTNIENAVQLIIRNILKALSTQCIHNNKSEEIYKIAKDCGSLKFVEPFSDGHETIVSKGRGMVSEIFGVHLLMVIDTIAARCGIKNNIVHSLTSSIAPVALATLNKINLQNKYSSAEMSSYLISEAAVENNRGKAKTLFFF